MKEYLGELGLNGASLVAGFMGGIISLTYEKDLGFRKALLLIFTGGITAGYLTPLIGDYVNIGENLQNGLSFIIGLTSMRLLGYIIKLVDKKATQITEK